MIIYRLGIYIKLSYDVYGTGKLMEFLLMAVDLDSRRRELAVLARNKKLRVQAWSRDAPNDWRPTQVRNPNAEGLFFTDVGAWHFIADLLEDGHPLEEITLYQPPDARGYVM